MQRTYDIADRRIIVSVPRPIGFVDFVKHSKIWSFAKWGANSLFVFATIILISPAVAAHSLIPWWTYIIGNIVLVTDTYVHKNYSWMFLGIFYSLYNSLILLSRIYEIEFLVRLSNFITSVLA